MSVIVHIAGPPVHVGTRLRQLCAWCGFEILYYDLANVAVPVGQDPEPATWGVGVLVAVEGGVQSVREHVDGADLPEDACAVIEAGGP